MSRPGRLSSRNPQSKYSTVVVFGDSYSDDEHRSWEPVGNPYNELTKLGMNSSGFLWPNHLVKEMSPGSPLKLYNYAYVAAHANNALTARGSDVPDTKTQIQQYLSDVDKGMISSGQGSILYILWIGINPLKQIWHDACDPDFAGVKRARHATDPLFQRAIQRVSQEVEEVKSQVQNLRANVAANRGPASYMIVTTPNIELAPIQRQYVQLWAPNDHKQQKEILSLLTILIVQYNQGLQKEIASIRPQNAEVKGFIGVYDIVPLWKDIISTPKEYGFKNVIDSCGHDGTLCKDVNDFFFWDSIHPTPAAEPIFARDMNNFILGKS
ncbi:hypothetical protein CROQUDRAFT_725288 [Cronartium quercuum f. sp. fusiforme G11]|uniref:GDSL esterase/lipase n=1 Tax=Cronartium quercuum f. sp. fusiforme G11 TaxID=708437 RepID=A0A9P6NEA0_9BASI|nr:hypothetical protein CROQUDRAFT_725288 [Cronartium quercuum f. sp. fusiforme G11]